MSELRLNTDGHIIKFGADNDINITHVADTGLTTNGTFQATTITATTAVVPDASDGAALGTTALEWSDLFLADGGIIKFGNDQDVLLTHVADTGLLLSGTNVIQFNDASQNIGAPSATVLDINATDEIELNATAVDLNGTLDVSGTSLLTGRVGVVTAGDLGNGIHIRISDAGAISGGLNTDGDDFVIEHSGSGGMSIITGTSSQGGIYFGDSGDADIGVIRYDHANNSMDFFTSGTERASFDTNGKFTSLAGASIEGSVVINDGGAAADFRVETDGDTHAIYTDGGNNIVMFGSSAFAYANEGVYIQNGISGGGPTYINRNGGGPLELNRGTNDGTIVDLRQAGTAEGFISVDGSTVSFTTFMGAHWSQLADNSKPTILRGTVMESIADMSLWHTVKYNSNQGLVYADGDTIPEGKSIGDTLPVNYVYQEYDKPANKNIGDTVTISHGIPAKNYTGVIEAETNLNLPKCKVSDTSESKAVYGVFHKWDDNDDGTNWQNDMSVSSLGTYMIRIHKDETVAIGDYIQSKGDGTGKKQADDILRASTIGKVTSTEKVITHADDSYCVPCTLHCG